MVVESLQLSRMGMGRLLDHFGCMTHFAENASQAAVSLFLLSYWHLV